MNQLLILFMFRLMSNDVILYDQPYITSVLLLFSHYSLQLVWEIFVLQFFKFKKKKQFISKICELGSRHRINRSVSDLKIQNNHECIGKCPWAWFRSPWFFLKKRPKNLIGWSYFCKLLNTLSVFKAPSCSKVVL